MNNVSIIGVGMTPVAEHWSIGLRQLGLQAMQAAMTDAGVQDVDALVVGNALAGLMSNQNHLGALMTDFAGMRGIEGVRVEAGDASGGLALRQGMMLIASGAAEVVLVLGVEKATDMLAADRQAILSAFLDADYEAAMGATPAGMMALVMRRYMSEHGVDLASFAGFSVNAHQNGSANPNAMFRNKLKPEGFAKAPVVADPVNLFDIAPEADGAAAVILANSERAADMVPQPIRILASAVATDRLAVHDREDPLYLAAVGLAAERAYAQSGLKPKDVDLLELHDSSTIMATLALEASGFAPRGHGWKLAAEGKIGLTGELPISTFGGLKARGNPLGATGVYQAVEAALQLRGQAGANQVADANIAMLQNVATLGGTAVVHLLGNSNHWEALDSCAS
ncbi:MAG: thiolase domain-containing protein [Anaerolineae bacterium]